MRPDSQELVTTPHDDNGRTVAPLRWMGSHNQPFDQRPLLHERWRRKSRCMGCLAQNEWGKILKCPMNVPTNMKGTCIECMCWGCLAWGVLGRERWHNMYHSMSTVMYARTFRWTSCERSGTSVGFPNTTHCKGHLKPKQTQLVVWTTTTAKHSRSAILASQYSLRSTWQSLLWNMLKTKHINHDLLV